MFYIKSPDEREQISPTICFALKLLDISSFLTKEKD